MPVEEDPLILIVPKKSPLLEEMDTGGSSLEHPLEVDPVRLEDRISVMCCPRRNIVYTMRNANF